MATSVKVDDETKSRIEELQAKVKLETGEKVTQQEVIRRLVRCEFGSEEAFVDSFRDAEVPLSEEAIERYLSYTFSSEEPIEEEDIDRILYDQEQL